MPCLKKASHKCQNVKTCTNNPVVFILRYYRRARSTKTHPALLHRLHTSGEEEWQIFLLCPWSLLCERILASPGIWEGVKQILALDEMTKGIENSDELPASENWVGQWHFEEDKNRQVFRELSAFSLGGYFCSRCSWLISGVCQDAKNTNALSLS